MDLLKPIPARQISSLWPLLAILAGLLASGCGPRVTLIETAPEKMEVFLVEQAPEREKSPLETLSRFSAITYETHLKRILVRVSTWSTFSLTDPKPLLTGQQIATISRVLAARLPTLKADQRIRFTFPDQYKNLSVIMDVHVEGEELFFVFSSLAREWETSRNMHETRINQAFLHPLAGQRDLFDKGQVMLVEPLGKATFDRAKTRQAVIILLDDLRKKSMIDDKELETLKAIQAGNPDLSEAVWKAFVKKRATLSDALNQNLFSKAEFNSRLAGLLEEMKQNP